MLLSPICMAEKIAASQSLSGDGARKRGQIRPALRSKVRPGGEADLTWNACIQLNKGVWLGCHGSALTLFHWTTPEVWARRWQGRQAIMVRLAAWFVEQETIA
jgi:hypothetical protein